MCAQESLPSISFVIPTLNASLHLKVCLKSIRGQKYPQERVEILILDGGSGDSTLEIAKEFGCVIYNNPKKLAEYGVQLGVAKAGGELLVVFAADNELIGRDWIERVVEVFTAEQEISALWGRLASGENDPKLNKYFELIQSDPLNWFLNRNLKEYLKSTSAIKKDCFIFAVDPKKPLVWGANGLVYRTNKIKNIWSQEGYLGDNDAFQYMVEQGDNRVAYFTSPFVYHHHLARLGDWVKKWKRNLMQHLLDKRQTRNMGWVFTPGFKVRAFLWSVYSALPVFSLFHSIYLSLKDRNIFWLYHPWVSCLQFYTYAYLVIFTKKGRMFLRGAI